MQLGLLAAQAALVSALVAAASHAPPRCRCDQPSALMLRGGTRTLAFRSLEQQRVVSYLSSFTSRISRWGESEWSLFDAPPLKFSTRALPDGVRLQYFDVGSGGALSTDGGLDITCEGLRLCLRPERGSVGRSKQDGVLFALLLAEARQPLSPLGQAGQLAPALFLPDTRREARLLAQIDSACMYDRKGQFERLKKGR